MAKFMIQDLLAKLRGTCRDEAAFAQMTQILTDAIQELSKQISD
jgi:hypothetical protein